MKWSQKCLNLTQSGPKFTWQPPHITRNPAKKNSMCFFNTLPLPKTYLCLLKTIPSNISLSQLCFFFRQSFAHASETFTFLQPLPLDIYISLCKGNFLYTLLKNVQPFQMPHNSCEGSSINHNFIAGAIQMKRGFMNLNWTPSKIHKIHSLLPFGLLSKTHGEIYSQSTRRS